MIVHEDWLLTSARAALHIPTGTAVLADLHLGYAEARHRSGEAVPRADLAASLAPLRLLRERHQACRVVIAGDLFEAGLVPALTRALLAWLKEASLELVGVVPGNHDRGLTDGLLPVRPLGIILGRWHVVHGDAKLPAGAVVHGHEHPCLRWQGMTAPCYLFGPERLVLPAFSRDAAGVNVLGESRWGDWSCAAIAGEQVLDFGRIDSLRERIPHGLRTRTSYTDWHG